MDAASLSADDDPLSREPSAESPSPHGTPEPLDGARAARRPEAAPRTPSDAPARPAETVEPAVGQDAAAEAGHAASTATATAVGEPGANLESLSDSGIRPIAYLLRTKCHPVAGTIGEAKDINVAKLFS